MENKKKGIYTLIAVCMIGVMALAGVGFAALTKTLTIGGSSEQSTVPGGTWDVHFSNLASNPEITGTAEVVGPPTLSATSISGLSVKLIKPGDSVSYTFDIANEGSLDAVLSSYTPFAGFTITGSLDTATEDQTLMTDNVIYTLKYVVDESQGENPTIQEGNTLAAHDTKAVKLTVGFDPDATQTPANNVTIDLGTTTLVYGEAISTN